LIATRNGFGASAGWPWQVPTPTDSATHKTTAALDNTPNDTCRRHPWQRHAPEMMLQHVPSRARTGENPLIQACMGIRAFS
jgi:hypothetical protein